MTELRKTYERVVKLIGTNIDKSTISHKRLNEDYFIFVSEANQKAVRIGLVQDMHTGRGFDNIIVEELTIKIGASDRVIMNRYNKLFTIYNNH